MPVGQIIVPLAPRAIAGLDAQQIADEIAPLIIAEARKIGGIPVGAPELLREDELRGRTSDPLILANVDLHPGQLWLLAEMVPIDQAGEVVAARRAAQARPPVSEIVVPPVRLPRGRRGRG